MRDFSEFRLAERPLRDIKTKTGPLPGTGWRRSTMSERSSYSVEINLIRSDEGAALYINCREAAPSEITSFETDIDGILTGQLEGMRSFSTWANGSLRPVGGLPGYETTNLVDDQFSGDLFIRSNGLVWQANAVSNAEEDIVPMLAFAESQILPQFLEPVANGAA